MILTNYEELIKKAIDARERSYSPYSGFKVGAAVLCGDGKVYTGCNVENASYSESICAERTAIVKAVSRGKRDFVAIAVVGGKNEISDFIYPCGPCRQVLSEFCSESLEIVLFNGKSTKICTLGQLFPCSFGASDIK